MSDLFAAVCSITTTRRRRFLWAAWWTAPPLRLPFRKPDAHEGGARTRAEALRQAQKVAGVPLVEIEPHWARAWARVLMGQTPWGDSRGTTGGATAAKKRPAASLEPGASVWTILGLTAQASAAELKRAFHKRALETHPDQGGDVEAFRDVQRAYRDALERIGRRKPVARRRR